MISESLRRFPLEKRRLVFNNRQQDAFDVRTQLGVDILLFPQSRSDLENLLSRRRRKIINIKKYPSIIKSDESRVVHSTVHHARQLFTFSLTSSWLMTSNSAARLLQARCSLSNVRPSSRPRENSWA
jgi:hypothetical protein